MAQEDYVSYETAKLLKEKGFDINCDLAYSNKGGWFKPSECPYQNVYCYRPTLQMAKKWLLEKHNILVIVDYEYECDDTPYYYKIYKLKEFGEPELISVEGVSYDKNGKEQKHLVGLRQYRRSYEDYATYQSASEGGIVYCLKELIK